MVRAAAFSQRTGPERYPLIAEPFPPLRGVRSIRRRAARALALLHCAMSNPPLVSGQASRGRDHRCSSGVNGLDDLGVVDALEAHGRDPEVAVAELPLDDHERDAFVSKFDRVRMSQLMRGKAAAHALAPTHQHRATPPVQIGLGQRQRPADSKPGAPQHDDQTTKTLPVQSLAGGAHHGDDLLHARRVRRVAHPLLRGGRPTSNPGRVAGERRRPAASSNRSDT
jgi:hypothetical protein